MEEIKRPQGFENECRDCTVRALSLASNIPYEKVHEVFKKHGRKNRCGIYVEKVIHSVCKDLNIIAKQVKRSGSLHRFLKEHPKGNYFCTNHNHAYTVIDGVAHDVKSEWVHIKAAYLIIKEDKLIGGEENE